MVQLRVSDYTGDDTLLAAEMNQIIAERTGDILPIHESTKEYVTDTYDIGSATYKWRNGYFSNDVTSTDIIGTSKVYIGDTTYFEISDSKIRTSGNFLTTNQLILSGGTLELDGAGMLITIRTEKTISAGGILTLNQDRVVLINPYTTADDTIASITSFSGYKTLVTLFNNSSTYDITLTHSTGGGGINLKDGIDFVLVAGTNENVTLLYNGTYWDELSRLESSVRYVEPRYRKAELTATGIAPGPPTTSKLNANNLRAIQANLSYLHYQFLYVSPPTAVNTVLLNMHNQSWIPTGYEITIINNDATYNVTIAHAAGSGDADFVLSGAANQELTAGSYDNITFRFNGTDFVEIGRALY